MKNTARPGAGIAYIVLTAGCFATSDATVKYLGASLPILFLLWSRYVFQTSAMALMQATRRGWRDLLRSGHPRLQALRAVLLLTNAACAFIALQYLPLAEYTALAMLAPMASTVLARLVLREHVSPGRWAMVVLGFIGMLIVVRPGSGALGWSALLPLTGAVIYAGFQIITNRLAAIDDMVTTNLYSGLGALLMLCVALFAFSVDVLPLLRQASEFEWMAIVGVGAVATLGQIFMVQAIRSAPLSTLTPFAYMQIAFATTISWLVFSHAPDAWAAAGMVLIVLAGAATVWLNARDTQARRSQAAQADAMAAAAGADPSAA